MDGGRLIWLVPHELLFLSLSLTVLSYFFARWWMLDETILLIIGLYASSWCIEASHSPFLKKNATNKAMQTYRKLVKSCTHDIIPLKQRVWWNKRCCTSNMIIKHTPLIDWWEMYVSSRGPRTFKEKRYVYHEPKTTTWMTKCISVTNPK